MLQADLWRRDHRLLLTRRLTGIGPAEIHEFWRENGGGTGYAALPVPTPAWTPRPIPGQWKVTPTPKLSSRSLWVS